MLPLPVSAVQIGALHGLFQLARSKRCRGLYSVVTVSLCRPLQRYVYTQTLYSEIIGSLTSSGHSHLQTLNRIPPPILQLLSVINTDKGSNKNYLLSEINLTMETIWDCVVDHIKKHVIMRILPSNLYKLSRWLMCVFPDCWECWFYLADTTNTTSVIRSDSVQLSAFSLCFCSWN